MEDINLSPDRIEYEDGDGYYRKSAYDFDYKLDDVDKAYGLDSLTPNWR